jgi:HK97 family phage major capsid protein
VDVAAVVVHSKVVGDLRKVKDANGLPLFTDAQQGGLPKVLGLPLIVSDRAPVITGTPTKYVTLFVLRGGLALWYNGEPKIETDRDILRTPSWPSTSTSWPTVTAAPVHQPPVVRLITQ